MGIGVGQPAASANTFMCQCNCYFHGSVLRNDLSALTDGVQLFSDVTGVVTMAYSPVI